MDASSTIEEEIIFPFVCSLWGSHSGPLYLQRSIGVEKIGDRVDFSIGTLLAAMQNIAQAAAGPPERVDDHGDNINIHLHMWGPEESQQSLDSSYT